MLLNISKYSYEQQFYSAIDIHVSKIARALKTFAPCMQRWSDLSGPLAVEWATEA